MSETQTQTPEPAAEKYVPQNVLASEESEDATQPLQQPPASTREAPEANGKADEDKPDPAEEHRREERRREAGRIGQLTRQKFAEKARADAAEQKLRDYEARLAQQNGTGQQPTQEQVNQWIDQRAAERVAAQEHNKRVADWDAQGKEIFGGEKFQDACKTVANMASDEQRRALLEVVLDTEGGQKAIMELAENADEAERILALPPHKMALALAKLGAPAPATPPKPISNAPPPIRPPSGGRARGAPDPEHGDMETYMRWSAEQRWRR